MEKNEDLSDDSSTYSEFVGEPPTKRHKCTFKDCNKAFIRPSKLADHLRRHSDERPFICDYKNCGKSYHKKDAVRKHQKRVHLKQTENALCPVDGCLQVMQKANLKRHMLRKHNNYRKYKFHCTECQKGFSKENDLKNHLIDHAEVYICHICEKVFHKGHKLRKHVKGHKIYECSCQLKFNVYNELRNHRKTCEYLTPQCQVCGVTFVTRSNLFQHYSHFHADKTCLEKFKCDFEGCNKKYNYKKNLNMHIRTTHSGENKNEGTKWPCETCGKLFKTNEYLKKHLKKFHLNPKPNEVKQRKPRFDKGIPKISMITQLTGVELTKEDNRNRIRMENQAASEKLENILKCNYDSAVLNEVDAAKLNISGNLSEHE